MNKDQYDTGFSGKLQLKRMAVSTSKGHKSKPLTVSETVSNVCFVLASGVRTGMLCVNKFKHSTTDHIHLLLLQLLRNSVVFRIRFWLPIKIITSYLEL